MPTSAFVHKAALHIEKDFRCITSFSIYLAVMNLAMRHSYALVCHLPLLGILVSSPALSCGDVAGSFEGKVIKERVLCMSGGGCVQEISVETGRGALTLTNSERPWVEAGDDVEVLKLRGADFTVHSRRIRTGESQSYFYKLARYCEASQ
ncbi:hypothetical protein [Halioglobus maricola]|uniref:hypothetical protein n=1 Tax=Halioglobus maricola TaxID=2601894 RepID=UPI00147813DD|nr:hypothetical protein [Halioglobus maricola]